MISADAAAGGSGGKPRPHIIVQSELFAAAASVTLCPLTTTPVDAGELRIKVAPSSKNGLVETSWIMVDKVMTVRRARAAKKVGRVGGDDLNRLNRARAIFLGLA